jgi:hypothetical protein
MERDGSRRLNLAMAIKNDIAGWTPQLRDRKIEQLTSVIATMNTGLRSRSARRVRGRNRFVVDRLVDKVNAALPAPSDLFGCSRRYRRGPRNRCCVHLRQHLVQVPAPPEELVFFHVVMRRHATREIVQVNFKTTTAAARTWAVFGNHWPSRSGGQFESEGYRAIAGETLGYFHQRVLEVHGPQTPVLAMGDFNDEPFDTSLVRHALSTRQRAKVTSARENPLLWNLMWPIVGTPDGSFYFDNQPNMLDQFMVNKNMATGDAPIKADPATVQILKPPAMVNPGVYSKPIPFGGMGKPVNQNGFTDHFPITITVTEAD